MPRHYAKNTSDETTTFVRYVLTDPNDNLVGDNCLKFENQDFLNL